MSRTWPIVFVLAVSCGEPDGGRTTVAGVTTAMSTSTPSSESSASGSEASTDAASAEDPSAGETMPLPGSCEEDAECRLHSDCCTCEALPAGDTPPACNLECERTLCEQWGITEILCSHTCLVRLVECDASLVMCDEPMPECDAGFAPSIEERCWTRHCVPVELCKPP